MDPFTGEEGIRFNLNGKKYVMQGNLLNLLPMTETDDGISINATMSGPGTVDMCTFTLKLCTLDQLAVDTEYKTGENGISSEISLLSIGLSELSSAIKESSETGDQVSEAQEETGKTTAPPIQLQGWIKRVASESAQLELLFEFNGKDEEGKEYVIKHGFLRL